MQVQVVLRGDSSGTQINAGGVFRRDCDVSHRQAAGRRSDGRAQPTRVRPSKSVFSFSVACAYRNRSSPLAALSPCSTEITKSVERSAVGLQSCTPSTAIELCQRRTARPATLPLKGVKTATPPPAVLKHNAYLAELVNEVQVQRERTERLERDRDNAEQAEQARMEQATAETKSLHSKLKEAFQKVTSGRQTAASLRETLSAHQSALSATEVTVAELTNELEETRDEVARLTQQLASSEDKALSAESAATESSEAALQAGLRLEQAEARATMLAERGSDLQSQLVDAQARSTGSATSAEEAKAALLQAEARHKAAVARVSELEAAQSSEKEWTDAIRQAREEMKQAEVHESELIRALSKEKSRRMVVETQVQPCPQLFSHIRLEPDANPTGSRNQSTPQVGRVRSHRGQPQDSGLARTVCQLVGRGSCGVFCSTSTISKTHFIL